MPKATIEYYWSPKRVTKIVQNKPVADHEVNVRILGANGLIVGQITQGFKDKRDARRGVNALCEALGWDSEQEGVLGHLISERLVQERGPGAKPKAGDNLK